MRVFSKEGNALNIRYPNPTPFPEHLREGNVRIPSGCAVAGIFAKDGENVNGSVIVDAMRVMRDRSNGLGGGFAAYGIYPRYKECYAVHVFYDSRTAREECERFLNEHFDIEHMEEIPTRPVPSIKDAPLIWRYFVLPLSRKLRSSRLEEREFVVKCSTHINFLIDGAFVVSSGKNMGTFKAMGYPEDVGEFYMLEDYDGYCFTAHGRYPTNTPGWWGGAHPFSLLDFSVVHNGEISSYDANKRSVEMYGYKCALQTDTEVITYIIDYLRRKVGLTWRETAGVLAAPFWFEIENMDKEEREYYTYMRTAFAPQLISGPFSILVGFTGGVMALNDRLKLRQLVVGERGENVYFASEECAVRQMTADVDRLWAPIGGEPVIVTLNDDAAERLGVEVNVE